MTPSEGKEREKAKRERNCSREMRCKHWAAEHDAKSVGLSSSARMVHVSFLLYPLCLLGYYTFFSAPVRAMVVQEALSHLIKIKVVLQVLSQARVRLPHWAVRCPKDPSFDRKKVNLVS